LGLIYLDTCLLIYFVERHPVWGDKAGLAMTDSVDRRFGISPLVKCECLVGPIRQGNSGLQRDYNDFFATLTPLDMPEEIYLQAATLRAHFRLKTPDALHLACAQHHRCEALWTNDDRLVQASHGLARAILDR
jgi:predicted nucleic acid-binding protein